MNYELFKYSTSIIIEHPQGHINGIKINIAVVIKILPTILSKKPALAIFLTDTRPVLYTMAFGGVATGNINA